MKALSLEMLYMHICIQIIIFPKTFWSHITIGTKSLLPNIRFNKDALEKQMTHGICAQVEMLRKKQVKLTFLVSKKAYHSQFSLNSFTSHNFEIEKDQRTY